MLTEYRSMEMKVTNFINSFSFQPLNILLDSNSEYPKVKITDFGLAKKMKNDMTRVHTLCGTRSFTAPELINTFIISKYDRRADIWSLGVVLYFWYYCYG